jgi:hypothetical protein
MHFNIWVNWNQNTKEEASQSPLHKKFNQNPTSLNSQP